MNVNDLDRMIMANGYWMMLLCHGTIGMNLRDVAWT